jgi:transformation/transcription domain-associated protein
LILRNLFRAISGGKFEKLYNAVLPLLPVLLETLNILLNSAQSDTMRDLFVELCLTVPVRLSVLLPYLTYIMRPLVLGLRGSPDLVTQGLRTFELCIDNLTHDFLEPILNPYITDLMEGLWRHLKPEPYNRQHSHMAARILGKLGGYNRRLLKEATPVDAVLELPGLKCRLDFTTAFGEDAMNDESSGVVVFDEALGVVCKVLKDARADCVHHEQAFEFVKGCLPLLLDVETGGSGLAGVVAGKVEVFLETRGGNGMDVDEENAHPFPDPPPAPFKQLEAYGRTLKDVVYALFCANVIPALKDEAAAYIDGVVRHFVLVAVAMHIEAGHEKEKPVVVKGKSSLDVILSATGSRLDGFVDGVVEAMSSGNGEMQRIAEGCMRGFYDACVLVFKDKEIVHEMRVWKTFASKFASYCYHIEWAKKIGGCSGISLFTSKIEMGRGWIMEYEVEFVKALLFVLKDSCSDTRNVDVDMATSTLFTVLRICNTGGEANKVRFTSLMSLLISELSNSNSVVRSTIQKSFTMLAEITGSEVTELLAPVRERLSSPIFAKPLRALPFAMQIGHIDAITYCLGLRPQLLDFSEELLRLLHEALALADAEDQALIVGKASQYKNATSLINLRVVCIKLLSTALACSDFNNVSLNPIRGE